MPVWTVEKGGYECSSKGDKRFSAFNAILYDGRSIETHYQCDVKGYDVGGNNWRLGKGKPALFNMSQEEQLYRYFRLWEIWAASNEQLILELAYNSSQAPYNYKLFDCFAHGNPINQAAALCSLLNKSFSD